MSTRFYALDSSSIIGNGDNIIDTHTYIDRILIIISLTNNKNKSHGMGDEGRKQLNSLKKSESKIYRT